MAVKIQIKRGTKAGLPTLAPGEYGLATDTNELFVGTASGNVQIPVLGSDGKIPGGQLPSMGYLPTAGGTMTGAIAMGGNKITDLAAPTEDTDAARKQDVDDFEPQSSAVQLSAAAQAALGLGSGSTLDDAMELLSGSRFVVGSRVGTGKNNNFTINFPEKPKCVFFLGAQSARVNITSLTTIGFIAGMDIMGTNAFYFYFIGYSATDWQYDSVRWRVSGTNTALDIGSPDGNAGDYLNSTGVTYYYIYIV